LNSPIKLNEIPLRFPKDPKFVGGGTGNPTLLLAIERQGLEINRYILNKTPKHTGLNEFSGTHHIAIWAINTLLL